MYVKNINYLYVYDIGGTQVDNTLQCSMTYHVSSRKVLLMYNDYSLTIGTIRYVGKLLHIKLQLWT